MRDTGEENVVGKGVLIDILELMILFTRIVGYVTTRSLYVSSVSLHSLPFRTRRGGKEGGSRWAAVFFFGMSEQSRYRQTTYSI